MLSVNRKPKEKAASRPNPSMALLVKLGSICIHIEELLSPNGHPMDKQALESLLADPEVRLFIEDLAKLSLLPLKRVG